MTAPGPVTVLVADDQESVRSAFEFFISAEPGMRLVGSAADGIAAVEEIRRLRPDVALLDIRMPGIDGIEVARRVRDDPEITTRVVMVTTFDLDEHVLDALDAGACGFLLKTAGPTLLVEAIRAAHVGDALISPSITLRLLARLSGRARERAGTVTLSPREEDVVRLVAQGLSNEEIGGRLHVTLSTVKTHLSNAQTKLDARNRVELAAWAWRTGLAQQE
jgi:DNA-binding NarL/FixJ family response regulator